jgi:diacylglycerol O-acyltransferase
MSRKTVTPVDKAWLRMEDPTNLMMITGVMVFGTPMEYDRLKATIERRLLRFDRFHQRVVQSRLLPGTFYWEDDAHFDIDEHLHRITLSPPGDRQALQDLVGELMSTPLDFSKPLWEVHLVEEYQSGCALIARLHHAIADGIALVQVLLSLTDDQPDAPWPDEIPATASAQEQGIWQAALQTTSKVSGTIVREGRHSLRHPGHALELVRYGARTAKATARLLLLWPDPKTPLKGKLHPTKRAAWSGPIPLAEVKSAGQAVGGTINDILLTVVAGALRRYLQTQGAKVENLNFRAVVPVNLRPQDEELQLGNKFGLVFLSLPVGIEDPIERLRELKRRMDALKDTPEPIVAFGILTAIGIAPTCVQDVVVSMFGAKGTGVMTNVPGPRETIYLANSPLETIMFWVPQSGHLGLGVSIISYAGQVRVGIATDHGLVPDPDQIVSAYRAEFDALAELARQRDVSSKEDLASEPASAESIAETTMALRAAIEKINAYLEALDQADSKAVATKMETKVKAPAQTSAVAALDRCQALTKSGRQCRNRPLEGQRFCHVHQPQDAASPP